MNEEDRQNIIKIIEQYAEKHNLKIEIANWEKGDYYELEKLYASESSSHYDTTIAVFLPYEATPLDKDGQCLRVDMYERLSPFWRVVRDQISQHYKGYIRYIMRFSEVVWWVDTREEMEEEIEK